MAHFEQSFVQTWIYGGQSEMHGGHMGWLRWVEITPRCNMMGSKMTQDASPGSPDVGKMVLELPKIAPKLLRMAPKIPKIVPRQFNIDQVAEKSLPLSLDLPKSLQKTYQNTPFENMVCLKPCRKPPLVSPRNPSKNEPRRRNNSL